MPPKSKSQSKVKPPPFPADEPINTCGYLPGGTQLDYWRLAFADRLPIDRTGYTRRQLFFKVADTLMPGYFEKHAWTYKIVEALCEQRWVSVTGAAGTAKTHNIAGFAVAWWLADPANSSVILCSTTRASLRKRAWSQVQDCFSRFPSPKFGNFVNSQMVWQCRQGDDKHAIFGKAVEEGNQRKVADDIKGIHTKRQMVIIDEATSVPQGIFDACGNLWSSPREFIMVVIGNMVSWLDPMGRFATPLHGRSSVTVDDEEWITQPQLDGKPGICLHFDALKSPNIVEGKLISEYLPTAEKVKAMMSSPGADSDPIFWSNVRGFPPPEGIIKTIFSEPQLLNGHAFDQPEPFVGGDIVVVGGFDPAYSVGGDKAAIRFARCGETVGGGKQIALGPPLVVPLSSTSPDKITYQLARGTRKLCEQYGCRPENLAVDSANSPGLCDVMDREWGAVIRVMGCGKPAEDRTVSHEDQRKCYDAYKNKISEMWFSAREYIDAGQVRGLDTTTAQEMIERTYTGGSDQAKLQIEPKEKFKHRIGHSPDSSDCLVMLMEAARIQGIPIKKMGKTVVRDQPEKKRVEAYNDLYESVDYSTAEDDMDMEMAEAL